ncbi:hypothetical protein D4764_0289930 [Takifugu flavidus]|uniref:Uncharacterized protein n=1 Tax=Takifugu flavidus TaxID=433684 RepID=A0A5C6MDH9_9TELE|nr:hypothetical protein D4764_0289930 [Takifugu flavidus]
MERGDRQADRCGVHSNAGSAPVRCGEERDEPKGEALDLPVDLRPTLTYGHELGVMTERTRSRVQAAEMSSSVGWLGSPLEIGRSQMRVAWALVRMPPGRLPGEVFRACPSGKGPPGRPRTRWRDYVSRLAWERLERGSSPWMGWLRDRWPGRRGEGRPGSWALPKAAAPATRPRR